MPEKLRKLLAKASEIRTKLLELQGDDVAEQRARLTGELAAAERAIQTALAEPDPADDPENRNAGEGAEFRALESRVSLGAYLGAAWEGRSIGGAELEYNQALEMGADRFPIRLLAPPEERATTATDTAVRPVRWVDRLFADTAAMRLGITFDSVAPGVSSHPVTTAGASAAQRGKEEAAADAAWTVGVVEMKPKRNSVRAVFTIEDQARIPGLEEALQRDLRMALAEGVDRAVFLGDDGANGTDSDIAGLTSATGVTETTITQSNKVKGPETLSAFSGMVDGVHAAGFGDLNVVASVGAWRLWETTIINSGADNMTLAAFMREAGLSWSSRGEIDTNTANGDFGAFIGRKRGITGAGVAAMWSRASLIRDPYSGAAKGEIALTLHYLWDLAFPRASNFRRIKFVT